MYAFFICTLLRTSRYLALLLTTGPWFILRYQPGNGTQNCLHWPQSIRATGSQRLEWLPALPLPGGVTPQVSTSQHLGVLLHKPRIPLCGHELDQVCEGLTKHMAHNNCSVCASYNLMEDLQVSSEHSSQHSENQEGKCTSTKLALSA